MKLGLFVMLLPVIFFSWGEAEKPGMIVDRPQEIHTYTATIYRNAEFHFGKNGRMNLDSGSSTIYKLVAHTSSPDLHDASESKNLWFRFKGKTELNRSYCLQNTNEVEAYARLDAMGPGGKLEALRGCFQVIHYSPDSLRLRVIGELKGELHIKQTGALRTEIIAQDTTIVFVDMTK